MPASVSRIEKTKKIWISPQSPSTGNCCHYLLVVLLHCRWSHGARGGGRICCCRPRLCWMRAMVAPSVGSAMLPAIGSMEGGEEPGSTAARLQPAGSATVGHISAGSAPWWLHPDRSMTPPAARAIEGGLCRCEL